MCPAWCKQVSGTHLQDGGEVTQQLPSFLLLLLRRRGALMQQLRQAVLDALGQALHGGVELRYPPPVLHRVLGGIEDVDETLRMCSMEDAQVSTTGDACTMSVRRRGAVCAVRRVHSK